VLPPLTASFISIAGPLQLINYPLVVLFIIPIYFFLVVLKEKGSLKTPWFKEWMGALLLGVFLILMALAMLTPYVVL
jgi:hypothetical protein